MKKLSLVLGAMLLSASPLAALAQTTPATEETKKAQPAKKAEPKKAEPKKPDAKKAAPKKAEPGKTEAKKSAPAKAAAPATSPNVTVLKNSQATPLVLRDKDGNIIPTNPDAYDVSSATGKKK